MTAICTNSDVFEFCGTPTDVQSTQGTAITNLIARVEDEIEKLIGRKITTASFSNVLLQHRMNCEIIEEKLYLKGNYRDTYSISYIYEDGELLTAVTDYDDGNDYYLDSRMGILIRNGTTWSTSEFAIKMTGSMGLGGGTPLSDIKQTAIEIVAIKAGLWKKTVQTDGGEITTERSLNKRYECLEKYRLRDF